MASNQKNLRAFIRVDGMGRDIPGSSVLRLKKPKAGSWREIRTYTCCDPQYDTTTTTSSTSTSTSTTTTSTSSTTTTTTTLP